MTVLAHEPYLNDADCRLFCGDALAVLRELPDESVHMCCTSPPFYGLRSYIDDAHPDKPLEIGLEETPELWVARLVEVFREVRRVLRPDATLWVECGDSYASKGPGGMDGSALGKGGRQHRSSRGIPKMRGGCKPKDLIGSPFLLALAVRDDGWYWRGVYPWSKPNAMPESAKDRCTTAHSYVFHFAKSARYYFDADAILEPAAWERWGDQTVPKHEGTPTAAGWIKPKSKRELMGEIDHRYADLVGQRWKETGRQTNGQKPRTDERRGFDNRLDRADGLKHPRSVWTIPTQGYPEAHFATWPEALAARMIWAGCPENGTVLDPFAGSGTTCLVARKLGRRSIGIDLSADYLELAARRLAQQSLFSEVAS